MEEAQFRFLLLEKRVERIEAQVDGMEGSLLRIEKSLSKYQGMAGASLILITMILSGGKLLWDLLKG